MSLATVLVPRVGEQPNPLIPAWAEILLQLLVLAVLVAVVVIVVRLVLRRTRPGASGAALSTPVGGLTPAQAYEVAYRFVAESARDDTSPGSLGELAASMQPVRDDYEGEESAVRLAWLRALEETRRGQPLPRA